MFHPNTKMCYKAQRLQLLRVSERDNSFRQVYLTIHAISNNKGMNIQGIQCMKYKEFCQSLVFCVVEKLYFYDGTSVFDQQQKHLKVGE